MPSHESHGCSEFTDVQALEFSWTLHASQYGEEIESSIAAAHEAGVIHNDLHEKNIAIVQNKVFIIDWGDATFDTRGRAGLDEIANVKDLVSHASAAIYGPICTPAFVIAKNGNWHWVLPAWYLSCPRSLKICWSSTLVVFIGSDSWTCNPDAELLFWAMNLNLLGQVRSSTHKLYACRSE